MKKIDKLIESLREVEEQIQVEANIMKSTGEIYPIVWSRLQREKAELIKKIELVKTKKTPFYRIFELKKERLEIKLAGALKGREVEDFYKSCGTIYPISITILEDEIRSLKKKLKNF